MKWGWGYNKSESCVRRLSERVTGRSRRPEPTQSPIVALPNTGSGDGVDGSGGTSWAPVAVVAAAAAGAAALRRWIPGTRKG